MSIDFYISWNEFQANYTISYNKFKVDYNYHCSVDGTCSEFMEYMQSSNNTKWTQFAENSASAPRVTNLRPPCWYAHSIVHAMPLCPDFPEELGKLRSTFVLYYRLCQDKHHKT